MSDLVTDTDLARARQDPAFRHRLVAESLERLLSELNRLRAQSTADPTSIRQMREAVALAVKLAELLQRTDLDHDNSGTGPASAA
jgi:hypothetical protein